MTTRPLFSIFVTFSFPGENECCRRDTTTFRFLGVSAAFSHYIPRSLFFFSRLFFSHFADSAVHSECGGSGGGGGGGGREEKCGFNLKTSSSSSSSSSSPTSSSVGTNQQTNRGVPPQTFFLRTRRRHALRCCFFFFLSNFPYFPPPALKGIP